MVGGHVCQIRRREAEWCGGVAVEGHPQPSVAEGKKSAKKIKIGEGNMRGVIRGFTWGELCTKGLTNGVESHGNRMMFDIPPYPFENAALSCRSRLPSRFEDRNGGPSTEAPGGFQREGGDGGLGGAY